MGNKRDDRHDDIYVDLGRAVVFDADGVRIRPDQASKMTTAAALASGRSRIVVAEIRRTGEGWVVTVLGVPGAVTTAADIEQVPQRAAAAVAAVQGVPEDRIEVLIRVVET